ncbi:serine/threonine protein kinase, partial [Streptomyces sp. NPDC079189]
SFEDHEAVVDGTLISSRAWPDHSPTTPVGPGAAPPGFGPPVTYRPPQQYRTPTPAQAHVHAHAPTQGPAYAQTYPGHLGQPVPTAPRSSKGAGGRGVVIALAAALVFGIAGGGTYVLFKDEGQQTRSSGSSQGSQGKQDKPEGQESSGGGTAESKPDAKPAPKPVVHKGINLTAGYHLTLGDDDLRPVQGEDGGYELSYDTGGYLDAESQEGNLVLLDPGQEGSLDACREDTRFTKNIYVNKLSKGRQICVTTGTGHMGLVTVQGFSAEDSPSTYMTLDVTVWRNAVASGSGG